VSAPGCRGPEGSRGLDQLDELLMCFRPIEKLFHLMGAVDPDASGGAAWSEMFGGRVAPVGAIPRGSGTGFRAKG
jgi:hypothetical protein